MDCWKSGWGAPLPDWQIKRLVLAAALNSTPPASAATGPSVIARRERQAKMHRQPMWRSVFGLDCPAHCLCVAACDR